MIMMIQFDWIDIVNECTNKLFHMPYVPCVYRNVFLSGTFPDNQRSSKLNKVTHVLSSKLVCKQSHQKIPLFCNFLFKKINFQNGQVIKQYLKHKRKVCFPFSVSIWTLCISVWMLLFSFFCINQTLIFSTQS